MSLRAAAVALCLMAAATPATALESWRPEPMWCRGPLGFGFEFRSPEGRQGIYLYFGGSSQPAGANGERLRPGTCGWPSRAFAPSDPSRLFMKFSGGRTVEEQVQDRMIESVVNWALAPDLRIRFDAGVGSGRLLGLLKQVMPPLPTWLEERACAPKPSCPKPGEQPSYNLF